MGLFDFLSKKKEPEPEGPSANYVFAHYALRQIALREPIEFLSIASSPEVQSFYQSVLEQVSESCGNQPSFSASELKTHLKKVNDFPCIVIEFPEPQALAEAHLIGIVVKVKLSSGAFADDPTQVVSRYFTLEKSITITNLPRTVLGEWRDQEHSNYGDGPEPDVDAFVAVLADYVK